MTEDRITADASRAIKGLNELEKKVGKKYTRQALRAACKVTLAVAVSTAPEQSGTLKRNIKVRSAGTKKGVIKMVVGIGKKWYTGPTFYAAFVAFGHRVGDRKLGDARRQLSPNEWMDHAYQTTKEQAVEVFKTTVKDLIEQGD